MIHLFYAPEPSMPFPKRFWELLLSLRVYRQVTGNPTLQALSFGPVRQNSSLLQRRNE